MDYQTIEYEFDPKRALATVWLARPDLRNALNLRLIAEVTDAVGRAGRDAAVRAVVLGGRGTAFCAGADLNWMKASARSTLAEQEAESAQLAAMLRTIAECPRPVIARVHGPAFAGGMGLVAASDIVVASDAAQFCLAEVKIGLIPAMVGPYVLHAIGARNASRWFLTGEVFDADEAQRAGLVHVRAADSAIDATIDGLLRHLAAGGPAAHGEIKRLVRDMTGRPIDDALMADIAHRIAVVRTSDEGREGIASFLEKRRPRWVPPAA